MFVPVNDTERLLMQAATDHALRSAFIEAVLGGILWYVPSSGEGEHTLPVRACPGPDGKASPAVFTSSDAVFRAFGTGVEPARKSGRALLEWLRQSEQICLNPGSDYGVVWARKDLDLILDGMSTAVVKEKTAISLGHPAQRPEALIEALGNELAKISVREAWLMLAYRHEQGHSWLLGVGTFKPWSDVGHAIRRATQGFDLSDCPLDVIQLGANDLSDRLRTGIPLLKPRKRSLLSFLNFFR